MPVKSITCCECAQTCEGNGEGMFLRPHNLNVQTADNFSGPSPFSRSTKKGYGKIMYNLYVKSWTYIEYHVEDAKNPYEEFEELHSEGNVHGSYEDELDTHLMQVPKTRHTIDFKYLCHGCASRGGWVWRAPCERCQARAQAKDSPPSSSSVAPDAPAVIKTASHPSQ
mmetsp:Transcript_45511/g.107926  ORF Transcript_45511/g.107926 Transcript_45511/m.107926 type:complete len:168 (+) Transcript_45511:126-629(+)